MRSMFVALAAVAVGSVLSATPARAQLPKGIYGPRDISWTGGTYYVGGPVVASPPAISNPSTKPYSYYVLPASQPSREYVGAPDVFPFYGRPYGHPTDRWSWAYMSSGDGLLNRYYYPPLGF